MEEIYLNKIELTDKEKVADKEELLVVLDADGKKTSFKEYRSVVHKNNLYHQEIGVIPMNDKKQVLLQRRSKNKKSYPNCWALCAGHVVNDQTLIEAAVMEANEELGVNISKSDLKLLVSQTKNDREDNKCYATCFLYETKFNIDQFKKQNEEVEELKWFNIDEFEKMIEEEKNCIFKNNDYYKAIIYNLKKLI